MDGFIAVIIWFVSLIVLSCIIGKIRFRKHLKNEEIKSQKNNKEQHEIQTEKNKKDNAFYRSDYKPGENCVNPDSYVLFV